MTTPLSDDLDRYRNRIKLAQETGMYDYATDMAELLRRLEVAEGTNRIHQASRDAINATWVALRLASGLVTTDDHEQHDSVMMVEGARALMIAGNQAVENAMRNL